MVENFRVIPRVLDCNLGIESEESVPGEASRPFNRFKKESRIELVFNYGEEIDRFSSSVQSKEVELSGFKPRGLLSKDYTP